MARSTASDAYCVYKIILFTKDKVMDLIVRALDDGPIHLTVERPVVSPTTDASVCFLSIGVAAKSEEILGSLAHESGYGKHILYKVAAVDVVICLSHRPILFCLTQLLKG